MGFFNFFGKKTPTQNKSKVKTDIHSHLIPGIDDGVRTAEEAIVLIKEMYNLGYERLVITPHIRLEIYENNADIIKTKLDELRLVIEENKIPVEVYAAAEYFIDEAFCNMFKKEPLMTFGNDKFLLIEFSHFSPPIQYKTILFELQSMGYRVILAHPERYFYFYENFDRFVDLFNRGIMFQLNIGTLAGLYDLKAIKVAEKLINYGFYTFVGTDLHNQNYLLTTKKALNEKLYNKLFERCQIQNDLIWD